MKRKTLVTRTLIILAAGLVICAYALRPVITNWHESHTLAAVDDTEKQKPVGPTFNADSAYQLCAAQCAFGPRTMNSQAHEQCLEWIAGKFQSYGLQVNRQSADLTGYDGTTLHATNIIARYQPEATRRIVIGAHWDSRPWADNDHDETNWKQPVMAANDGASGVAVMLEIVRLLSPNNQQPTPNIGIDFVCFDAEDWGTPMWSEQPDDPSSWALGARHWANQYAAQKADGIGGYDFGILLDMVGGEGARFFQEGYSQYYASSIVRKVWRAANAAGKGNYFPRREGGGVTDDHVPMNQEAGIPTIDIIPYYPDCTESSFGPTWHTVHDTMEHIDKNTLSAVGQTLIQVIYSE